MIRARRTPSRWDQGRAAAGLAALVFGLAACGDSNRQACERYVTAANVAYAQCGYEHLLLEETETCPLWLDLGGADCTAYYDCLRANAFCCTEANRQALEQQGRTCELDTINFAAMEACSGCR